VMPTTTPAIKVEAVQAWGARAVLVGDSYDDAYAHAMQLQAAEGYSYIPPYDDPDIIAGQGTVAMEILRQQREPIDAIFVPVGGGGLLAGVISYVKHVQPEIKVIGVEPDDAACLRAALNANARVELPQVGLFADGVAVKQIGAEPFRLVRDRVDDVVLVDADAICAAIKDIFEDTRSVAEPAGALAVAGLKRWVARHPGGKRTLVAIDSGANMNFDRLRHVAERADLGEQREVLLAVTIPERPGAFSDFCQLLGDRALITEFNYRYGHERDAHVFVGVGYGGRDRRELIERLQTSGLSVVDLTHNEMAKLHVRYMVGGRALAEGERLLRFEFPERPGALIRFLAKVGGRWNISMFHYRNHGAAFGRVLAGLQVRDSDADAFARFVQDLEYPCVEETENPAYQLFLRRY
jgi:threonine dehydratase